MNIFAILFLIFIVMKLMDQGKKKNAKKSGQSSEGALQEGRPIGEGTPLGEGIPLEMPSPVKSLEMKPFVSARPETVKNPAVQPRPLPEKEEKNDLMPPLLQLAQEKEKQVQNKEFVHSFASRPQTIAKAAEELTKRQEKPDCEKQEDETAERRRQDLVRGVIVSEILNRPNRANRFPRRI